MPINVKQFLARQLNDHSDSPSGVVQPTYFEWTESHIGDAIQLALCYVYSLIPREFSTLNSYTVPREDCVISLCEVCIRYVGLASLEVDGEQCITVNQETADEQNTDNNLFNLLDIGCTPDAEIEANKEPYTYEVVDGSNCVLKFNRALPVGSVIRYMCSNAPESIDELSTGQLCSYSPLIADYALWWLFRTDSESRSNLARAQMHFEAVRDFVNTKLLLEFSLTEDDYSLGRRKVDD